MYHKCFLGFNAGSDIQDESRVENRDLHQRKFSLALSRLAWSDDPKGVEKCASDGNQSIPVPPCLTDAVSYTFLSHT